MSVKTPCFFRRKYILGGDTYTRSGTTPRHSSIALPHNDLSAAASHPIGHPPGRSHLDTWQP
ncbi:MAG: hypothetical protein JW704_00070 [Anaerolineaceae bacterium]|nr:hypothetical protein [Anaerolineaceae bacterium]MBN2677250.1 hypothetical protein [Anaerolineaceae bacterium]